MRGASRSLTDWFSIFGRRTPAPSETTPDDASLAQEPLYPTKALGKFLRQLQTRENPTLIDLGPVVGSNVTFFGEQLGCRMRVEDLAADLERHAKTGKIAELPTFLASRFPQQPDSIDGVLCWDVFDHLDRPAAQVLSAALTRLLKPDGALLAFFSTAEARSQVYTKYVIVDMGNLRYRTYPSSRARQRAMLNRDIIKLFESLRVTDSFLMKSHLRELLFRKPAYLAR